MFTHNTTIALRLAQTFKSGHNIIAGATEKVCEEERLQGGINKSENPGVSESMELVILRC